jgi:SAM-dependent methyltransferase
VAARFDHSGDAEQQRTADLLRLVPTTRSSMLDVGARDGHFSRLLTQHFSRVVALDLRRPEWTYPGVETMAGDVTHLPFPDGAFDVVFCAEVLEHVADLTRACAEIGRVARHEILVGVPYRQDTRIGRVTCPHCGSISPSWGHLHTFDDNPRGWLRLMGEGWAIAEMSRVGPRRHYTTNRLSTILLQLGGHPWGTYDQDEPCPDCHQRLFPPSAPRSRVAWLCAALGDKLNKAQWRMQTPHETWLHVLFVRT